MAMKSWRIKTALFFAVTLIMASGFDAIAQRGQGMSGRGGMQEVCPNIPGLTEEQRSEIMDLRTSHMSEMQQYRDQIDINRAQYRALMRSEPADMTAIEANIEERADIRTQMQKKQAGHHQSVRQLLTEEQRVWFDSAPRGGAGARQGMRTAGRAGRGFNCPAAPGGRGMRGEGIMRNQRGFRGL